MGTIEPAATAGRLPVEQITDDTCPRCGSDQVEGDCVETGENTAQQGMSCLGCNARWTNVYDFVAVYFDDVDEDEVIEVRETIPVRSEGAE